MRILTISDKVEPVLYGPYIRERVGNVDLILACGDLPDYYLDYIASSLDVPLYYVYGNHDKIPEQSRDGAAVGTISAYSWAVNLHCRRACYRGLLLAGLEGCRQYNPGARFQYTEAQVRGQVRVLTALLLLNKLRYGRYLDILITHAPPRGIHDAEDLPHQGFKNYLTLLQRTRPLLMIHGHQHVYNRNLPTETVYGVTRVLNTYGYRVIELAQRDDGRWELVSSSR